MDDIISEDVQDERRNMIDAFKKQKIERLKRDQEQYERDKRNFDWRRLFG